MRPSQAEPQCSSSSHSSSSSPSKTHSVRLCPTTTGPVVRYVEVPSISITLPTLTTTSLGSSAIDQAEQERCQAMDQADQTRCQAGRGDHQHSAVAGVRPEEEKSQAEQRQVRAEQVCCQADQAEQCQEDDLPRCQADQECQAKRDAKLPKLELILEDIQAKEEISPNYCICLITSLESHCIVCMPDQLTLNIATSTTDLGCAKPPTRLPANFGVRNSKCNKIIITKPQQARNCKEPCLKPREPSDRARPTNQERDDRDGAAVFRPANGGGERDDSRECLGNSKISTIVFHACPQNLLNLSPHNLSAVNRGPSDLNHDS